MTEAQIKHMVDRFLGWKLPEDFTPDAGIKYAPPHGCWSTRPSGTNLLDALQADAMVRYLIEGMPASSADVPAGASEEGLREIVEQEFNKISPPHTRNLNGVFTDVTVRLVANAVARRLSPSADLPTEETLRRVLVDVLNEHGNLKTAEIVKNGYQPQSVPLRAIYSAMSRVARPTAAPADLLKAAKEARERCVKCCENEMPATQDTVSSQVCDALSRAISAIRNAERIYP